MEADWRKNVVQKEMEHETISTKKKEGRKIPMVYTARKQGEYKDDAKWRWVISNQVSGTETGSQEKENKACSFKLELLLF